MSEEAGGSGGAERGGLTTLDRVMLAVVVITLAGSCLLISSGRGTEVGHRPWGPNSILRIAAQLLTFNYQYPTQRGVEVKWLVEGLGAAAALLAVAVAWYTRTGRHDEGGAAGSVEPVSADEPAGPAGVLSEMTPATAAQVVLLLFAGWAMLSALWAPWPAGALAQGVRPLIATVWAIALGRALGRRGARVAVLALVVVLTTTAAVGVWYFYERNPQQRLKFPIGNPIFLAACLIPGLTLTAAGLVAGMAAVVRRARGATSESSAVEARPGRARGGWWLPVGSAIGLVVMAWAFTLADSRGPMVGLAAGTIVAAYLAARAAASRRLRSVILAVLLVAMLAGGMWFRSQLAIEHQGRGATIRLRLYAWKYALGLFLERPVKGRGEGAYTLLATRMSRGDAQHDPAAFPAVHLAHAHSEWLEIVANLGAVGIALCGTGLGITFWSGTIALRRKMGRTDWWCLIGLEAALVAIIVEEAADVALRKPGLPIIFYTVIGLIWAMSRGAEAPTARPVRGHGGRARTAVLAGAIAAAVGIAAVARRDWVGALATQTVIAQADRSQWAGALEQAAIAETHQLSVEDRLYASYLKTRVAHQAARHQVQQIHRMIARLGDQERGRDNILQLAREDSARFDHYFRLCLETGESLLKRMPVHHAVAGLIADAWLLRQNIEETGRQLGLRNQARSYAPIARRWMQAEYGRDPLDADNALRLFSLSGDQPLIDRLNLLRLPLRRVGRCLEVHGRMEAALAVLMQAPEFESVMARLRVRTRATMDNPDALPWPDRYAPETLRLDALAACRRGEFARASAAAAEAAKLSAKIGARFPTASSYARLDQAHYLLLAHPEEATRAVAACRQAVADWPMVRNREEELRPLRRDLSFYLLAAGDEEGASRTLRLIDPTMTGENLQRNIGYGLAGLCRMFVPFPQKDRPAAFGNWLDRSLRLAPGSLVARQIAVHVAFESGDDAAAIAHLEKMEQIVADPQQMAGYVRNLLSQFPDNPALRAFIASRTSPEAPATQPAATAPASLPSAWPTTQ